MTILLIPNNLGASGHWLLIPEGRQAECKPLKQVLNKQSGEETVCGFSVQMPLCPSLLLSRVVHEQQCFPV